MKNPLTKEHLETLRKLDRSCAETRQFLETCKGCFLDLDEEIALNEEQSRICEQIRTRFFPAEV